MLCEVDMSLFDIDNVQTTPIKAADWKWSFSDYPQEKNGLTVFSCFACGGGVHNGLQTCRLRCDWGFRNRP